MFKKRDQQLLAEAYDQIRQPTPTDITSELLSKALQAIRQEGKISTPMIQRVLRVDRDTAVSVYQQIAAKLKMPMPENLDTPVQVRGTSNQSSTPVESKHTYINAIRHAQKTNDQSALQKATADLKSWAQANNAMQDPDVVEYLY
jgi:hypothetical protein